MSAPAVSRSLWAPIATPDRGRAWVMWLYVRRTRRACVEAFLEQYPPENRKRALERTRFARVTITEETSHAR